MKTYLDEIKKIPLLTPEEEEKASPEELVVHNLRLVVPIAKTYQNCGLPLSDLIQEGNIGLIEAANLYDPTQGRFSTFATYRIKHSIGRALSDSSRIVRLPAHIAELQTKVKNKANEVLAATGALPTNEELAEILNLDIKKVISAMESEATLTSLDEPVSDSPMGEIIPSSLLCESNILKETDAEVLRQVLGTLTPKEEETIVKRFGLWGQQPLTLESTGKALGVSKERVRQLQSSAMRKLRNPCRADLLRECFL